MSRYLSLANTNLVFGRRKKAVNLKLKRGPYTTAIVLVILICLLSLFFLAQVFQSSTKGYEISNLQQQAEELKEKNKALEIKAAELRSFDKIREAANKLNMIKSETIVYLQGKKEMAVANR